MIARRAASRRARRVVLVARLALVVALVATGCGGSHSDDSDAGAGASSGTAADATATTAADTNVTWRAEVVTERTRDTGSFTQGFEIDGAVLYESSGLYGKSTVRAVERATGRVLRTYELPAAMFAEGLTKVGDHLVVLTWKEHVAIVLDAATFAEVARAAYDAEGWGICSLGNEVVTSDGSARLTIRDPQSLVARRSVEVRFGGAPVAQLNELECVSGAVYANVWQTDRIVRIDPATGVVTGHADLPQLRPPSTASDPDAVLNGIAYDAASATFLLTGKRWPTTYEVRLVPAS